MPSLRHRYSIFKASICLSVCWRQSLMAGDRARVCIWSLEMQLLKGKQAYSPITLKNRWHSMSFLSGKGEEWEYCVIPYNQDQPPAVCWSSSVIRFPGRRSGMLLGGSMLLFSMCLFPSCHCGGRISSSPQWTWHPCWESMLKSLHNSAWSGYYGEEKHPWPFCHSLSPWTWMQPLQRPKAPVLHGKTRRADLKGSHRHVTCGST